MTHIPARMRLPGESSVKRSFDGYEDDNLTPEQVLKANLERFGAAKTMAEHLADGAASETNQRKSLEALQTETGVEVPPEDTVEYSAFLTRYKKGQMTEDEKQVRNAFIDLGQIGLKNMLAESRAQQNQKDDFAFATAHLDVLRAEAEAEMKNDFKQRLAADHEKL